LWPIAPAIHGYAHITQSHLSLGFPHKLYQVLMAEAPEKFYPGVGQIAFGRSTLNKKIVKLEQQLRQIDD
jgi:hypothetical protein